MAYVHGPKMHLCKGHTLRLKTYTHIKGVAEAEGQRLSHHSLLKFCGKHC